MKLWIAAAAALVAIVPPMAGAQTSVITNPDWIRRPSGGHLERYYPTRAMDESLEGRAVIRCLVTAEGLVTACAVQSESPGGFKFGEAALKLSTVFRMRPQTRDGTPVDGAQVEIPMVFRLAPLPLGDGARGRGVRVAWAARPTQAQLDALRPSGVDSSAIRLRCQVVSQGADAGGLHNCELATIHDPTGDLARAAVTLLPAFRLTPEAAAQAKPGARIEISFHWPLEAGTRR